MEQDERVEYGQCFGGHTELQVQYDLVARSVCWWQKGVWVWKAFLFISLNLVQIDLSLLNLNLNIISTLINNASEHLFFFIFLLSFLH